MLIVPSRCIPVVPGGSVRALGGNEFAGSGSLFAAFGEGGDIVTPWEIAGDIAASANAGEATKSSLRMWCYPSCNVPDADRDGCAEVAAMW